jgi:diadenosine tetraphosphate (Ap4A) HIT family hydrolase
MTGPFGDRLEALRRGESPTMLARMRSGYAVIGDTQHLPGYCLLLSHVADADHLTDLPRPERTVFLADMALLGEAILAAVPDVLRINYDILGNSWGHLHAHVFARYAWEPHEYRRGPVWRYDEAVRQAPEHRLGTAHEPLRAAIAAELARLTADAYA